MTMIARRASVALAAITAAALLLPAMAQAQSDKQSEKQKYPTRSITVIVPFPAGGPSDVVARIVTEGMSKHLGQSMVIENVGGAGGTLGSGRVASAAPDAVTRSNRPLSWVTRMVMPGSLSCTAFSHRR
jgi:tripartite-type tricarboxylate transporter receptor subunit TctC